MPCSKTTYATLAIAAITSLSCVQSSASDPHSNKNDLSGGSEFNDVCKDYLEPKIKWVTERLKEVASLKTKFDELDAHTPFGLSSEMPVTHTDNTTIILRIIDKKEIEYLKLETLAYSKASALVENSRRVIEIKVKSKNAFDGLVHLITANKHDGLINYMKQLGVARIKIAIETPVISGKMTLGFFDTPQTRGSYFMLLNGQPHGRFAQDDALFNEYFIAYSLNSGSLKIEFINKLLKIDLKSFDLNGYGTASLLARDLVSYLGFQFDPFCEDSGYFVPKNGALVNDGKVRLSKKVSHALQILYNRSYTYVDLNYIKDSRKNLPSGWIKKSIYNLTWGIRGFGSAYMLGRNGEIDGIEVDGAISDAVETVESLGYVWDDQLESFSN